MRALFLMGLKMRKTLAFLSICLLSPLVGATSLDDIRFAELPNQKFEVRLNFDQAPPEPHGYTIESPARIVLDFPDVESELKERRFPLSFDNGKSALVLTSGDRTRLILNLENLTSYSSRIDGNAYVIEVGGTGERQVVESQPAAQAASVKRSDSRSRAGDNRQVKGIDFRRGDAGEGRVIVDLSTDRISADMRDTAKGLRVTFANATLPSELRRRLDVLDFATPVSVISAGSDGGDVVLEISANGDYDYLAYQTDKRYVISVKPLTKSEKAEQERLFEYTGSRLSFNFQDIEVRAVLQIIADFTDVNLVASDTVQGRITLRLDNVPWDQALDMVLKTKSLDKRQVGNVLMVAPGLKSRNASDRSCLLVGSWRSWLLCAQSTSACAMPVPRIFSPCLVAKGAPVAMDPPIKLQAPCCPSAAMLSSMNAPTLSLSPIRPIVLKPLNAWSMKLTFPFVRC